MIRVFKDMTELGGIEQATNYLVFSSVDQIVLVLIVATVSMFLILIVVVFIEAFRTHVRLVAERQWSCATVQTPTYQWDPAGTYVCFLSHYKMEAASDARYLHDMLRKMLRAPVYLDSSTLSDLRTLFTEGVHKSDCIVLLATKGVLTRPWCLLEILEARRKVVPIVPVGVAGLNLDVGEMRHYICHLEEEMGTSNPSAL